MPYLLIHHTVPDYERFKKVFDDDAGRRRMNGCKGGSIYRAPENPSELVVLFDWDDLEKAQKFAASYGLHEAVKWAGDQGGKSTTQVLEKVADVAV